jgi:hypothetical protein
MDDNIRMDLTHIGVAEIQVATEIRVPSWSGRNNGGAEILERHHRAADKE